MGYTVDESAGRFANYFLVLRELVHLTAGHLALEPRFEVKALLGDHLHDDARSATKILRRLHELGGEAAAPAPRARRPARAAAARPSWSRGRRRGDGRRAAP